MNTTPKEEPGRHGAGARLARELAGLLLVAAGIFGVTSAMYALHPLAGAGFVAVVLMSFGVWTLLQRPRRGRIALGVGILSTAAGTVIALGALWSLSPVAGLAATSIGLVAAGLWLTSGEVR
ncbi:hypothetical protein [Streptomyces sp. MBT27]|uniref:hypothetical protein n=1 Tax=Streptomyces sp. MBT27 TaxID=1488356 RepID=UPI001420A6F3|nr:hypothetical protein [Streptomyces sp. MBT27]